MTDYYCNSAATGLATGLNKTDAVLTIQAGLNLCTVAGDRLLVQYTHSEPTGASITYTSPVGTTYSHSIPVIFIDFATDKMRQNTSVNWNLTSVQIITFSQSVTCYGGYASAGYVAFSSFNTNTGVGDFKIKHLATTGGFILGDLTNGRQGVPFLYRGLVIDGSSPTYTQPFVARAADIVVEEATLTGGSILAAASMSSNSDITVNNSDFSAGSWYAPTHGIVDSGLTGAFWHATFNNCKFPGSLNTYVRQGFKMYGQRLELTNCLIGSTWVPYLKTAHEGDVIPTTAVYNNDTTAEYRNGDKFSLEFTKTFDYDKQFPIGCQISSVVTAAGSKTFTVQVAHDYTSLTTAGLWMEVELASAADGTSLGTYRSSPTPTNSPITVDYMEAGSSLTSSSATWTGAGGLTLAELSVTATVAEAAVAHVRVFLSAYESTKSVYVDPVVVVS